MIFPFGTSFRVNSRDSRASLFVIRISSFPLLFRFCQFGQHTKILQCSRVAGDFCAACDLLEQSPHDFAAARFWERLGESHFIWFRDSANMHAYVIAQSWKAYKGEKQEAAHSKRENY